MRHLPDRHWIPVKNHCKAPFGVAVEGKEWGRGSIPGPPGTRNRSPDCPSSCFVTEASLRQHGRNFYQRRERRRIRRKYGVEETEKDLCSFKGNTRAVRWASRNAGATATAVG